jgi:CheY-like chemotaxis protein
MPDESILVVEDDGLIALHMTEILTKAGYRVRDPLPSGEEAIEQLRTPPYPDLILMDIGLIGNLDGIETVRRIHGRLDIPVLFLTAYSDNRRIAEAISLNAEGYILKPFGEKELLFSVQRALHR